MNAQSHIYCLALYPRLNTLSDAEGQTLLGQLSALGLLGEAFSIEAYTGYKLAAGFYQLLSFMGCSPALKLEPESKDDKRFCHFHLAQNRLAQFRYLRPDVKARCPQCRKPSDMAKQFEACSAEDEWECPHCHQLTPAKDINWKHEAGISQSFIELRDVHPHEVVPTDGLLKALEDFTGQPWDYFYTTCHL